MHIFLTGDVQVGKSTIIKKTLAALKLRDIGGFRSVSVPDLPDGAMSVYLIPAGDEHPMMGNWNRVGIRKGCGRGIEKIPEAFERAGVQALVDAENMPLILMDEVGRMESAAARFSERILAQQVVVSEGACGARGDGQTGGCPRDEGRDRNFGGAFDGCADRRAVCKTGGPAARLVFPGAVS